jgi:hypothetical protein
MHHQKLCLLITQFQIIRCLGFSRYITFAMHLDIHYVIVKVMYPKNLKRLIIWNEGSTIFIKRIETIIMNLK